MVEFTVLRLSLIIPQTIALTIPLLVALPEALTTILLLPCSVSATLVSYSGDGNDTLKATSCKHNKVAHHHVNKVSGVGDYAVLLDNDKSTFDQEK